MSHIIDCKGLNCPLPVINTKKHFDNIEKGIATTIVDNEVAKNNVVKFAKNANLEVSVSENDNLYHITITKGGAQLENLKDDKNLKTDENFTIVVSSDKLGNGAEELGEALIKSYLFALSEADIIPNNLIFLNSGVKLVVEGSLVLESINKLKERGVNIYSCGLCLDFYKIKDKVQVGEITNMYAIIEMMNSGRTIKL